MDSIIEINNLTFLQGNKKVIDNLNLEVDRGDFVSIIGPNGSGKSTLVKLLLGLYESDCIKIDNLIVSKENIYEIRKKIGVVFDNPNNQFIWGKVEDDLAFSLENLNYPREEIRRRINEVSTNLGITNLLNKNIKDLSGGEKQKVALATSLITNPDILILDEAFCMVDKNAKKELLNYLLELHNTSDITIINITHDLEEVLNSDKIVVLNNGVIEDEGYTKDILREEKKLKSNGLDLPFSVDLSLNLKYYGLLDELIYDLDEMVVRLWK